jgi:EAL domain-containing protein (putative c-di-GMP-specific phosphodiesterase class I)
LYLLEQVCRQIAQWIRQEWIPLPVSINLSAETLRAPSFAASFAQVCEKYGVAPELIELELPESVLQNAPEELIPAIEQIHRFNFRCALDNFGKRTIPLDFLRELNIDTIKLDQNLLSSENNNRRSRFMVEAILKLSTQIQIHTVAEGIDNASQVQYLKQAGCDMIQGYYYFLPMPMEEFCYRVFYNGQPGYADGAENNTARSVQRNTSNKITMFSLQTATDQITFSNLFSPVLEDRYVVNNATALFRHSQLIHGTDQTDFFRRLNAASGKTAGSKTLSVSLPSRTATNGWKSICTRRNCLPVKVR